MTTIGTLLLLGLAQGEPAAPRKPFVPTERFETLRIEGWTIRADRALADEPDDLRARALRLLEIKLNDVSRVVPAPALAAIRRVPVWMSLDEGTGAGAEYHPSRDWLVSHGHNPDKAKAVEIGSAAKFIRHSAAQPAVMLHELAHAYHDQVLGFDHPDVKRAFEAAVASKSYENVLKHDGRRGRHYALSNAKEYFAEGTEAFFSTNDFYPFVRAELKEHDPGLYDVLKRLWSLPAAPR
jgi:hypothetical protein